VPASTVGYEKLVNWAVTAPDEATFVRQVLEGQPEPPAYFARMKRVNREGPAILSRAVAPPALRDAQFMRYHREGAVVVDLRAAAEFACGFIGGAINVPLSGSFTTYAGSALPYDVPITLIAPDEDGPGATEAARDLSRIGFDTIVGWVRPSVLTRTLPLETIERVGAEGAIERHARGAPIVDVRNRTEWSEHHVRGALHIPFTELAARAGELPRDTPVLVQCETGARSAIATSVLRRLGIAAADAGGIVAWEANGGPVETATG
jgi:hydroxyacylglutathione hydrolase